MEARRKFGPPVFSFSFGNFWEQFLDVGIDPIAVRYTTAVSGPGDPLFQIFRLNLPAPGSADEQEQRRDLGANDQDLALSRVSMTTRSSGSSRRPSSRRGTPLIAPSRPDVVSTTIRMDRKSGVTQLVTNWVLGCTQRRDVRDCQLCATPSQRFWRGPCRCWRLDSCYEQPLHLHHRGQGPQLAVTWTAMPSSVTHLSGATRSVNRELEAKARALPCSRGLRHQPMTAEFLVGHGC
jgi:hypothetical protein